MKVLTIGRSEDCHICIEDPQNLISKKHAILRFYPLGKIEIVPLGRNLTYINGKAVKNEKAWSVSRKDVISFAHVKDLDWDKVPNPYMKIYKTILWAVLAIFFFFLVLLFIPHLNRCSTNNDDSSIESVESGNNDNANPPVEMTDSISGNQTKPKKIFPTSRKTNRSDTIQKSKSVDDDQEEIENKNVQIF